MNKQEWITDYTRSRALELSKKPITVSFEELSCLALCYQKERIIVYNTKINTYSIKALEQLAIHEVCHLRYVKHNKRFRNLCRKMGIQEDYWLYGSPEKTPIPTYMIENYKYY